LKILYLPHQYSQQRQREKKRWIYPVLLAMEAEYYRQKGHEVYWDMQGLFDANVLDAFLGTIREEGNTRVITEPEGLPFHELPPPNRILTDAKNPKYQDNGNFKYRPGTYIQSASNCWYGKCSFCAEKGKVNQVRDVADVIKELRNIQGDGYKEVFDDSGTFPLGKWLNEFCAYKSHPVLKKLHFSCNMRFGTGVDYTMLKDSGFRMLLYGLESANQSTLDILNKGVNLHVVEEELREARRAGLEPHIAVMFGYPWESEEEENRTLEYVHYLLRKGYAKTAQASLYTVEGEQAIDRGNVDKLYEAGYSLPFWFNRLRDIKRWEDLTYLLRGLKKGLMRD